MEPGGRLKRSQLSVELEFPAGKSVPQQSEKLAAEESAQNLGRQEELPAAGDPAGSVWRESSCRHDAGRWPSARSPSSRPCSINSPRRSPTSAPRPPCTPAWWIPKAACMVGAEAG